MPLRLLTCVLLALAGPALAADLFVDDPPLYPDPALDTDGDGVPDADDSHPDDDRRCRDVDGDTCDDCWSGTDAPDDDGLDLDADGLCDDGDDDADGDGADNDEDEHPLNPRLCWDTDADRCDDCALELGVPDAAQDGADFDEDGACDFGDGDDDNDGVPDLSDDDPFDRFLCGDVEPDGCEDCALAGRLAPEADGPDLDGDGLCDSGDDDQDGDSVDDDGDSQPRNPFVCVD